MPKITGSITSAKKHYNDDFFLKFNGSTSVWTEEKFLEIRHDADWSLSWDYFVNNTNGGGSFPTQHTILVTSDVPIAGSEGENGLLIYGENNSNVLRIRAFIFNSGGSVADNLIYSIPNFTLTANTTHLNLVFTYKSSTQELSLYNNTKFVDSFTVLTTNFQNNGSQSLIGGDNANLRLSNWGIKNLRSYDVLLTDANINFIYQTGVNSSDTDVYLQNEFPLNNTAFLDKATQNYYIKLWTEVNAWDSGVLFSDEIIGDGYVEYEILSPISVFMVGLSTLSAPVLDWNFPNLNYAVYADLNSTGYRQFTSGSGGVSFGTQAKGDIIKIERVGTNINVYLNTVLQFTWAGDLGANLKPTLLGYSAQGSTVALDGIYVKNVKLFCPPIFPTETIITSIADSNGVTTDSPILLNTAERANSAKSSPINKSNGVCLNFNSDALGLNAGTGTFTSYADFYTKIQGANFSGGGDAIIYKSEELRYYGLQFDSASGHNLTIQGLNTAKTNGYTFLVAVANKSNGAWSAGQSNIFSHIGTEGAARQFVIEGSTSNTGKATKIVFPSGVTTSELESYADNDFDNSKIQFASFALSPNQDYYLTYDKAGNKRGYGQSSFNTNVNQTNSINTAFPLSFGFNEITTPTTKIGYNGTNSLDGVLCYFAIVEGLENQATIKRQFNNGLLSNPSDFERLGLNLVLFADLNNPFDDAGTIKIPDLGVNNYTIIANSDLDATWSTLAGVQSSQVELKTLL